MAVNRIDLEVYDDPSMESQYKIGNTITTDGSNLNIEIDDTTLGGEELINPGYKYWVRAKAYNSEGFESEWANGEFVTMPYPDCQIVADYTPYLIWWTDFDPSVTSIQSWGASVSPNEDGTNAVNYTYNEPITDPSQPVGYKYLFGLQQHTEYFYVPFYMDSLGRYYQTPWEEAYSVITKYEESVVNILDASTLTDSITLTIDRITDNPNVADTYFRIGSKSVRVSNGVAGEGTYTITNGDSTTHGSTIEILPDTDYTVDVMFYTNEDLTIESITVHTSAIPTLALSMSVDEVTSGYIDFWINVYSTAGVGVVEVQYKQGSGSWVSLQTEVDTGIQRFRILTQPNTQYTLYAYIEDAAGEMQDSRQMVVTTPSN